MRLDELREYVDGLLDASSFRDYCPNGLQVEGRPEVASILCGVTASQALLEAAVSGGYDAVFVHHGWFWRGEDGRVTGIRKRRMATLLKHDISLFAYHLPLDAHPELGNNAQLARVAGWKPDDLRFGEQQLGWVGTPGRAAKAADVAADLARVLARPPQLVGDAEREVKRIAWCTGAAQGYFEQAIAAGADVFVSGEISEQTVHLARESGVPYIAAGHHATERYGIRALGHHLQRELAVTADFLDLDNPV